jgi:phenylalanyl-tRNA synthetase beta chain
MKFSEKWLREWVNPDIDSARLVSQLTNAGLEVDSVTALGGDINDIVVAKIVECRPHPAADRLQLCTVDAGDGELRSVVCGAPNARTGLVSAFAQIGATLPGGHRIKRSKIRGEVSEGMLCSERELALSESHEGIMELAEDAPLGADLVGYLDLDDTVIEVDLTPNRGECLSINGIAREVGAINGVEVTAPDIRMVPPESEARFPVALEAPADCPRYVGRIVSGIDQSRTSPLWMQERLRRSGVRPISPVVDVTNYVMLELGQPMHAFDLNELQGGIRVRRAQADETLELLDGRVVTLRDTTLVIADEKRAVALAGIMGGVGSGVTDETVDVFLESAYFDPTNLAGQARHYALHTDASHRYERGVDPELQRKAMERATQLLTEIVGGGRAYAKAITHQVAREPHFSTHWHARGP